MVFLFHKNNFYFTFHEILNEKYAIMIYFSQSDIYRCNIMIYLFRGLSYKNELHLELIITFLPVKLVYILYD